MPAEDSIITTITEKNTTITITANDTNILNNNFSTVVRAGLCTAKNKQTTPRINKTDDMIKKNIRLLLLLIARIAGNKPYH